MKVVYITGSRADFGLMQRSLQCLHHSPNIELGVMVTGQHLLAHYGHTIDDIIAAQLPVIGTIPVEISGKNGVEMGEAFCAEMAGFLTHFQADRPDLVLVLGDRGEMLAASLAAIHCGICVGHIHGGEVTGTLDESLRHAISKLSHFHFVATDDARLRLIRMGEREDHIWVIGAPGLVGIAEGAVHEAGWLQNHFGIAAAKYAVMCVFHPVVQEAKQAGQQMSALLSVLEGKDCSGVLLRPNSDAGAAEIDAVLDNLAPEMARRFVVLDHLERSAYLKTLANVDLLIGNSSSGIIESASFGIANVNIGSRQEGRLRNANTVDCLNIDQAAIASAFDQALALPRSRVNIYGDGQADQRLVQLLSHLPISPAVLAKKNTY